MDGSPAEFIFVSLPTKNQFLLTKSVTIKAAVFNSEKRLGSILYSETINYHKASWWKQSR